MTLKECETIRINDINWFHETTVEAATQILKSGFKLPDDPVSYMYGKGVYFLDGKMPSGRYYGPMRLAALINGNFLKVWLDYHPTECNWFSFHERDYKECGYRWDKMMEKKKKDNPGVDGYMLTVTGSHGTREIDEFENMLVVWNLAAIKQVYVIKK